MFDDYTFALCLTHDVDRPSKGLRSLYYAYRERPQYHLKTALRRDNPYWQFDAIMDLEDELGVRSAFYLLNEPHLLELAPSQWFRLVNWVQHLGRYDLTDGPIEAVIGRLDAGGWEVGLHGSFHSYLDRQRLSQEKDVLEGVLGHSIRGGRQHYLRLSQPETWRYHADIGLVYDASLGSSTEYGFQHGYDVKRPFDDEFVVFPLTVMEVALPDPGPKFDEARAACDQLLREAAENDAVMTVLWHPRFFNEREFPGYRPLYRLLIERALDLGAWVGPPGDAWARLAEFDGAGHEVASRRSSG